MIFRKRLLIKSNNNRALFKYICTKKKIKLIAFKGRNPIRSKIVITKLLKQKIHLTA